MTINELIVQLIHTGMQHGFNLDIAINDWDKYQSTLEGIIQDGCFDCIGTELALDSLEWQQELTLVRSWLSTAFESKDYKEVNRVLNINWAKYEVADKEK